jgi:predicted nucleic acid-binding protein
LGSKERFVDYQGLSTEERITDHFREKGIDPQDLIALFTCPWVPDAHKKYLKSHHWRKIKQEYWAVHIRECSICELKKNIHLHHRTYVNLWNESFDDLVPLCAVHHHELHDLQNKYNLAVEDASDIYMAVRTNLGIKFLKQNKMLYDIAKSCARKKHWL